MSEHADELEKVVIGHAYGYKLMRQEKNNSSPEKQRDELLIIAKRLVGWMARYPSHRIYTHNEIVKILSVIDGIADDAKSLIEKIEGGE